MRFSERGYLDPPDRYDFNLSEIQAVFVDSFPASSTRRMLFHGFVNYNQAFQLEVTPQMVQWIGGSFTTKKLNPRDIDVVTIIPYEVFDAKQALIEERFRKTAREKYGVDAYIVSYYPEDHNKHGLSKGVLVYWDNQFSKTRKNRAGDRYQRGYCQIIHQKFML